MLVIQQEGACRGGLREVIPASLDAVEQLFVRFRNGCKCLRPQRQCFAVELLLREALTNAVVHGSQSDPARRVRMAIRVKRGRFLIAVEDEGPGFDWRATRGLVADSKACSGRGMEIFRSYATRVRFNEKGNGIALRVDLDRDEPDGNKTPKEIRR